MRNITPYPANGCPKLCSGCGDLFMVREGRAEAIVGHDGRLYCYGRDCERGITAPHAFPVSRVLPRQVLRTASLGAPGLAAPGLAA